MRLIFNALALLLATTALAAPLPSRSNDALTDGASTGEHTLTHHHHLHHMKHAKHAPHHEETEVEARSLFNDDLEERSFYDEEYTQLERRNGEKKKPKLSIVTGAMTKLFKGKNKAPPSSSSKHSIDGSRHVGSPLSANHGNPTPFNAHAGPSNQKFSKAQLNKSLPPTPHSPHRSNSLPSAGHHDAPPPYSRNMHVVNPGSSTSGSVRHPPQRSMTTGSMASLAGTHGSSDRHSIDTPNSASSVAGTSYHSHQHRKRDGKSNWKKVKAIVKSPFDLTRSKISQTVAPNRGVKDYTSKEKGARAAKGNDNRGNPLHITPF